MLKQKKTFTLLLSVVVLACVMLFQNCNGTRIRSADYSISMAQLQSQITALSQTSASSLSAGSQQGISDFFDIVNLEGAKIYYSEAPSSMGDLQTVMPLDFSSLNISNIPTSAAAYLAIAEFEDGIHGALLITKREKDNTGAEVQSPIFAISSTQAGTQDETDLELPMTLDGNTQLFVRSSDIIDGELGEVIQIEIIEPIDDESEYTLGLINLVEPI